MHRGRTESSYWCVTLTQKEPTPLMFSKSEMPCPACSRGSSNSTLHDSNDSQSRPRIFSASSTRSLWSRTGKSGDCAHSVVKHIANCCGAVEKSSTTRYTHRSRHKPVIWQTSRIVYIVKLRNSTGLRWTHWGRQPRESIGTRPEAFKHLDLRNDRSTLPTINRPAPTDRDETRQ